MEEAPAAPDPTSEGQLGGETAESTEASAEVPMEEKSHDAEPSVEGAEAVGDMSGAGEPTAEGEGGSNAGEVSGEVAMADGGEVQTDLVEPAEAVVEAAGAGASVEEAPGPPPPPPPPAYVPPEVGDDYIPVADLPPLPLPYGLNDEGKKVPLPGIVSLFLTGRDSIACKLVHQFACG